MCKKLTFEDVRPDLKKYYKPELNDGKIMSDFKPGSNKKIVLCCDICEEQQTRIVFQYGKKKCEFACKHCNSFGVNYVDLLQEWDYEKNKVNPYIVSKRSIEKVHWKCSKNHKWEATINSRTSGTNCPICCYVNDNNCLSNHMVSKEWHSGKNKISINDVSVASDKNVWWQCANGHEWIDKPKHRTYHKRTCPHCKTGSSGEKLIEEWLKENNIRFLCQFRANINGSNRFFDLYIPEEKIFVEVHGRQHFEQINYYNHNFEEQKKIDKQKQQYAETHGRYIMVDYREHKPELALERFIDQLAELA